METRSGNDESYKAAPVNGGDGEYSYAQICSMQHRVEEIIKNTVRAIFEKHDLQVLLRHSSNVLRIADLGCSVGPNPFFTVQNIIDVVTLKLQSQGHIGSKPLEFQVFFDDHIGNNFQYYETATPGSGSFHGRLFLKSSIHFFNSSYCDLHWLSRVPKDIVDRNSPAYNKGGIYLTSEDNKVVAEAYSAQFERDFESFLNYRALELVPGGIMTLIIPCVPPNSGNRFEVIANIMEDVLLEMVNKGIISNEVVDSFNLPIYMPTSEEVKGVIEKNGNFEVDDVEEIESTSSIGVMFSSVRHRAMWEVLLKQHFGEEVVDNIFMQLQKKFTQSYTSFINCQPPMSQLFIIHRNFYLV